MNTYELFQIIFKNNHYGEGKVGKMDSSIYRTIEKEYLGVISDFYSFNNFYEKLEIDSIDNLSIKSKVEKAVREYKQKLFFDLISFYRKEKHTYETSIFNKIQKTYKDLNPIQIDNEITKILLKQRCGTKEIDNTSIEIANVYIDNKEYSKGMSFLKCAFNDARKNCSENTLQETVNKYESLLDNL